MENIIEMLKQKARDSWSGKTGEERAERLEAFLMKLLPEYAEKLGAKQDQVLRAIEGARDYCAVNYYQESNFPSLDGVAIHETQAALMAAIHIRKFRCPCCDEVSTNPYECNSGANKMGGEDTCDWKSYGLLGTLGKGYRFIVKDKFLDLESEHCLIDEIFMPIDLEAIRKNDAAG